METTRNPLTVNETRFFDALRNYLNTPIYFYGSVQRDDYFPGKSDIDVDIFTDNEASTITMVQHFLHVKRNRFKRFFWRSHDNNELIVGHKIVYNDTENGICSEISIYNDSVKDKILKEHRGRMILPFYVLWALIMLKVLFYQLHFIEGSTYRFYKRELLTTGLGQPPDDFVVVDPKTQEEIDIKEERKAAREDRRTR
jgi:hypothetical protein